MLPPTETSKSENSEIQTLQPIRFTDILDGMFSLYRRHFRLFAQIAAIAIFADLIGHVFLDFISENFLSFATIIIITFPLSIVSIGGVVVATAACYSEEPITARAALQQVGQRFFPLLVSAVLWCLVVVVLGITVIGIPFAIYFAVRWGFFVETLLLEGISVRNALKRSSELVSGVWWRVCGMLLAVILISVAIHAVFEISFGVILILSGAADGVDLMDIIEWGTIGSSVFGPDNLMLYLLTTGVHLAISVITFPIWVIGVTLLYFNQRIQKEGFDIQMRANVLRNLYTKGEV
ncbi:MAG: hypothetical protein OXN25_08410 [Candidatus Poribacteria bacterium]|nr:hypothetical protein [Candidatus Poribacteria bacterium]